LNLGVESLINDEQILAIRNHKHATKDLYDSIAAGQFPKWKLFVQIMDPAITDSVSNYFTTQFNTHSSDTHIHTLIASI